MVDQAARPRAGEAREARQQGVDPTFVGRHDMMCEISHKDGDHTPARREVSYVISSTGSNRRVRGGAPRADVSRRRRGAFGVRGCLSWRGGRSLSVLARCPARGRSRWAIRLGLMAKLICLCRVVGAKRVAGGGVHYTRSRRR
jgi:hypothetical protein